MSQKTRPPLLPLAQGILPEGALDDLWPQSSDAAPLVGADGNGSSDVPESFECREGSHRGGLRTVSREPSKPSILMDSVAPFAYGSKLKHQGTAGFGPWFHFLGFQNGHPFLTHYHLVPEMFRKC